MTLLSPGALPGMRVPARALILKPCCLGDVLWATPLLETLSRAWPETRFDWAVDEHSREVLVGNPAVSELVDASGCIRGAFRPGCYVGLLRRIRSQKYDVAFVPDRSPLLALAPLLAGVPVRVGLDSGGRGWPHTVRVPIGPIKHEAELYLDLARAIGLDPRDSRPVLHVSEKDRSVAQTAIGSGDGLKLALHPGGGVNPGMRLTEKRWPAEKYGRLVDQVADELGARTLLLGGPGDRDVAAEVVAAAKTGMLDLSGRLTLGQTAAVIEACDFYVGNDTGVTHLATAVGTPVVAIFGPTDPLRYGPTMGTGVAVAPGDGAVDRLGEAKGSAAISLVSVADVLTALRTVLPEARPERGPEGSLGLPVDNDPE